MKRTVLLGASLLLSGAAGVALPAVAAAAATCTDAYTCAPPTNGNDGSTPPPVEPQTAAAGATTTNSQSLAFTGANIEVPALVGVGAIAIGGTLYLAGRRQHRRA
jgi:hypothetical protein